MRHKCKLVASCFFVISTLLYMRLAYPKFSSRVKIPKYKSLGIQVEKEMLAKPITSLMFTLSGPVCYMYEIVIELLQRYLINNLDMKTLFVMFII